MSSSSSRTSLRCAALFAFCVAAGQLQAGSVVTTASRGVAQAYLGSEHRKLMNDVATSHPTPADVARLQPILDWCAQRVSDASVTYVSVQDDAEAEDYRRQHPEQRNIVLVDSACPGTYKLAAFLAVEGHDMPAALAWLDKAIAIAPLFAEAYNERGFILGQTGKPSEGATAYRQALELLARHPDPARQAVALRGLGYNLVDLGDLAGARAAYEQSLRLDPDSDVGKRELAYVIGEQAKAVGGATPAPASPPAPVAGPALGEESRHALQLIRDLETAPLGDQAKASRAWLLGWEEKTSDVDILVCDTTGLLSGKKQAFGPELMVQDMFGNAAWQLEHPDRKHDEPASQLEGVRSTLRAYEAILQTRPKQRIASLDTLLAAERAGNLEAVLRPVVAAKCSREGAVDSKAR